MTEIELMQAHLSARIARNNARELLRIDVATEALARRNKADGIFEVARKAVADAELKVHAAELALQQAEEAIDRFDEAANG